MNEHSQFYKTNSEDESVSTVALSTLAFAFIFLTVYLCMWFLMKGG